MIGKKVGNITAVNSVPNGIASANSAVEINLPANTGTLGIQVVGTYTGVLSLQLRRDDQSRWETVGGTALINQATGAAVAAIPSATQGLFQADVTGFSRARIVALAAVTGTAVVSLGTSPSTSVVALGAPIPAGTNSIGTVNANATPAGTAAAATTGVASSATSVTIIAASATRKGLIIHNASTSILYIRYSSTAAANSSGGYTVKIAADGYWEMPQTIYTGAITGIWAAANGFANVTQLT